MDNGEFIAYARDIGRYQTLVSEAKNLEWTIKQRSVAFKEYPAFATTVTDHAALKATERIQEYGNEQPELFSDIINTENPDSSLGLIANMKSFIIFMLAQAYVDCRYTEQPSKNNPSGVEFKYVFIVPKWRFTGRSIEMIAIVEGNNVKTVFFNWKENI